MTAASTQCPKCNTTFRVSDAQLQVAKGKVRCGSCLHVFRAADHWVGAPATPAKPSAPPSAKPATAAGKFQFDQSAIDHGSADKVLTKPAVPAVNTLGEMRAAAAKPPQQDEEEDFLISDDDEGLINDGQDTSAQKATSVIQSEDDYSDLFLNLDDLQDDDDGMVMDESLGVGRKSGGESADESWAKDMLDELVDDSAEKAAQVKSILNAGERDNIFTDDGHVKKREGARDGFISGNSANPDQALRDLGMDRPPAKKPLSRREMLSTIEPAPVDIQWQGGHRNWMVNLVWSSLVGVAVLALLIQYAWIHFDTLARENGFRPVYGLACGIVGCELPDQFDPEAIRSSNLVVRTDPAIPYALAVDAIVQNTASYAQPFPELELYFTDLNSFPVASRRFKPQEYLAGELAGKKEMPPAKSVHISLQIVDPGPKAVSYHLQISDRKPTFR